MRFNIVSNLNNSHGLQREYEILRHELERRGHGVHGIQFNKLHDVRMADVNVFIETVVPKMFPYANHQWAIPHPEWWLPEYQACLSSITQVLCKTHDCFKLFQPLVGDRATYVGFMAQDWCKPDIRKQDCFLHVAGKSQVKNTDAIMEAWRDSPYSLTVVSSLCPTPSSSLVTVKPWISDEELCDLYNRCWFHLCPSQYEGYGHALHEGMGCGAIVITTDAPSMNEFRTPKELLLPATPNGQLRLATLQRVQASDVAEKVVYAMSLDYDQKLELSRQARHVFEDNRREFQENLSAFIERVC